MKVWQGLMTRLIVEPFTIAKNEDVSFHSNKRLRQINSSLTND